MGTHKDQNSDIDEDAIHVVEGILRGGDWSRSKPQPDKVGLDMLVNLLEDRHPAVAFFLQVKGMGPKTRKRKKQSLVSQAATLDKPIELEHLDYYMKLHVPVFLVVVDVVNRAAYYVHIQRYLADALNRDDWRKRLNAYKGGDARNRSRSKPTKTIRVPSANVLFDTSQFKETVRDAHGYMTSLAVEPGIAYREGTSAQLDNRFKVTYLRKKDGDGFHIDAKEPVELKLRGKMPKKKLEQIFGKGVVTSLAPGELTIEGSPLWEKITKDAHSVHITRKGNGFVNIIRLDAAGELVARIDYLHCDIEGGHSECRFKAQLPSRLVTFEFSLDLEAMIASPKVSVGMTSTFGLENNLSQMQGCTIDNLDVSAEVMAVFCGITRADRLRIEVGAEGTGIIGSFSPPVEAIQLFASAGTLYEALMKAKAIAIHFQLCPKLPARLQLDDLRMINFLYELIQGREVPTNKRLDDVRVWVERDRLMAATDPISDPNACELALASDAHLPFLGLTIHIDHLVRVITRARLLTRRSDIKRQLGRPGDTVKLRFAMTSESTHTLKLGVPSQPHAVQK